MGYQGNERRRHKVYITRNTEYHVRDGVCVAVRDRQSHAFRAAHIALTLKLEGTVKIFANGTVLPHDADPQVGDAIYFNDRRCSDGQERQIVTSRLEKIDRPSKKDVMSYV